MPYTPAKPCRHPGCAALVERGRYCPAHIPPRAPDSRPSAARRGYNKPWRHLRRAILAASPLCVACKAAPATEVDHILPLRRGGTNDLTNLQTLCKSCHSRKTAFYDRHPPEARGLGVG